MKAKGVRCAGVKEIVRPAKSKENQPVLAEPLVRLGQRSGTFLVHSLRLRSRKRGAVSESRP